MASRTLGRRPGMRAVFRLAAGSRIGFGHLVRGRALARALEIGRPIVSLRGGAAARAAATTFRMRLVDGAPLAALTRVRPDVLILDDPSRAAALPWCHAARALGLPVVSIHDLGLAFCGADLTVDGSVVSPASARTTAPGRSKSQRRFLSGPFYAILDPSIRRARGQRRDPQAILIALGGGPRVGVALKIAAALRTARPGLQVRIAAGLTSRSTTMRAGVTCLGPRDGLASELARCAVAITGGGVSLYEASALDTPVIAWPVVKGQQPTVIGFHRRGLATAVLPGPHRLRRVVTAVLTALDRSARPAAFNTIDGLGAARVADAIRALIQRRAAEAA